MSIGRMIAVGSVVALLVSGCAQSGGAGTPTSSTSGAVVAAEPAAASGITDFDGDGRPDVVAGGQYAAVVRYGTGRVQEISTTDLGEGPQAGTGVLARDLNADGYTDLVVTQPGWPEFNDRSSPSLYFLFGSAEGLDPAQAHAVLAPRVAGFGASLALVEEPTPVLVVGAPGDVYGGSRELVAGGTLVAFPLGADGLPSAGGWVYSRSALGLSGKGRELDEMGTSLASSGSLLLAGIPMRDLPRAENAGEVAVLRWDGYALRGKALDEDTKGVPGTVGANHNFGRDVSTGDGYAVVSVSGTARVQPFRISGHKLVPMPSIDRRSAGFSGKARSRYGVTVAMTRPCAGTPGVLVGAGWEPSGARSVFTVPLVASAACPVQTYTEARLSMHEDEQFPGCAVAALRHADPAAADGLVLGSCGDSDGVIGYVHVLDSPDATDDPLDATLLEPALSDPQG